MYGISSPIPESARSKAWSVTVRLLGLWARIPPGVGCLSVVHVVCCQVEVSALGWSLVRRNPTDCGVSKWVWSWSLDNEEAPLGAVALWEKMAFLHFHTCFFASVVPEHFQQLFLIIYIDLGKVVFQNALCCVTQLYRKRFPFPCHVNFCIILIAPVFEHLHLYSSSEGFA